MTMKKVFTHTGYVVGVDERTPKEYRRKVELRETKTMWVSSGGQCFIKNRNGHAPGKWPKWKLDIGSIEEKTE